MITVTITGLDDLIKKFDSAPFEDAMDNAVALAAAKLRDDTKVMPPVSARSTGYFEPGVPVDTGRMREAIVVENKRRLAADIAAKVDYSILVEEGTSRMPARPFFDWMLNQFGGMEDALQIVQQAIRSYFS